MPFTYPVQTLAFSSVPVSGSYDLALSGVDQTGPIQWNAANSDIIAAFLAGPGAYAVAVTGNTAVGLIIGFTALALGSIPTMTVLNNTLRDNRGNQVFIQLATISGPILGPVTNTASTSILTNLQNQANALWIQQACQAIQNAVNLGQSEVYLTTFEHCVPSYLLNFFQNIGYYVTFPDWSPLNGAQPGELFGAAWIAYWENQVPLAAGHPLRNPVRIGLSWTPPFIPPFPPFYESFDP
jgi:hypothetical protein